ncbi:polynucleotide adenylyltransferase PcnB [Endozoicomonas sp. 8E]|uniref:polynucleotide adenylyltransferase PcnB n=1 Tax=Endozoicomonas sp. 8E TaxID=3035692 RepID=UPI00293900F6|nr:polynucleotide adenylyltransferase PcnB [Endozoicomonas sp. 8E]WOG27584.1 polynucleotide adenylyltransferase PcnB [Endozoicomonas sp. 8E]
MTGIIITVLVVLGISLAAYFWLKPSTDKDSAPSESQPPEPDSVWEPGEFQSEDQTRITQENHPISRREISENALKVLHRLNSNGYEAYLVGGCIRDLYLDLHPKDFDVATNATPEQVRRLFRNSRIIGRRFKLVHILFGREMIEVATFRAGHDDARSDSHSKDKSDHSDSGRILRDNVYGSMKDDAIRRDFTVNALYYDVRDYSVIDYCGGVRDLENQTLKLIGDPVKRYHEDPVRMIRALRFVAKLDFDMDPATADPIYDLGYLLSDIPSARLFDEVLKLLQSGKGVKTFHLLREYSLLQYLFPATHHSLEAQDEFAEALIIRALESTDSRIARGKPVTPAFLFAAFLWAPLQRLAGDLREQGVPPTPALQQAAMVVLDNQCAHTAVPKRFTMVVRDIWEMQYRLERRQPKTIESLMEHPKFRASYDFLVLREATGEALDGAGGWWTDIQDSADQDRNSMIRDLHSRPGGKGGQKRRRRRPRKRPPVMNKPQ